MEHILIEVCKILNVKYRIEPVLYASYALEKITKTSFKAKDIDLLVPSYVIGRKKQLIEAFIQHGYEYIEREVLTFRKEKIDVELSDYETWEKVCEFNSSLNKLIKVDDASYLLMGKHNLLKLYHFLYKDKRRSSQKHKEDIIKLKALNRLIDIS